MVCHQMSSSLMCDRLGGSQRHPIITRPVLYPFMRDQAEREKALAIYKRKQLIWAWINGALIVISVVTGAIIIAGLIWLIATKGDI
jgi:uncharacterized membrane protein